MADPNGKQYDRQNEYHVDEDQARKNAAPSLTHHEEWYALAAIAHGMVFAQLIVVTQSLGMIAGRYPLAAKMFVGIVISTGLLHLPFISLFNYNDRDG